MTRKLVLILFILIFFLLAYITYIKKDYFYDKIKEFIYNKGTDNIITPTTLSNNRSYNFKTFKIVNDFEPNNINDLKNIFYTILNNGWNEFTFYCPYEYKECSSDIKNLTLDKNFIAILNNYVSPYNSFIHVNTFITDEKEIYIKIDKLYTEDEIKTVNDKIDNIIKDNNITSNTLQDIKKVHKYIINTVDYDDKFNEKNITSPSNKAIGALNGKAVCSGYADLFALIMDKINVPNFKVSSENHIWNVIYVDNKWLHVDVTWDDDAINPDNQENFFMINNEKLFELDKTEHSFDTNLYKEIKSE